MNSNLTEHLKTTKKNIRKQLIQSVFNQFDSELMKLPDNLRRAKYQKMKENPFRFYRGSAFLFYFDMANIPFSFHTPSEKPAWIQGDLHFENFGAFQNERGELVYDVNDFDEGYLGSYLYDIVRMCVSIALYGESLGLDEEEQKGRIREFLSSYYAQLERYRDKKESPYTSDFSRENTKGPVKKVLKKLEKRKADHLISGITVLKTGKDRQFIKSEEIQHISEECKGKILEAWPSYISSISPEYRKETGFYEVKDLAAKKGSGTASIGLDRYYALIEGEGGEDNDLILEIKEVRPPVPGYFLPFQDDFWEAFAHQGKRVAATQQAMHHYGDPYLGFFTADGKEFYVRERSPYKKRIKAKQLKDTECWDDTLAVMGRITAKIHSRADKDIEQGLLDYHSEEEILKAIGSQFDIFQSELVFTAMTYKRQVILDYEIFCSWLTESQSS
ncbi:DUF2252 domain-containing protein [Metabacillus sp. GX 13764]|uniref:DUF2252 domain-containing protein n=1 Tax=Metabacillus kandeliae TaxID=2900151 RepID=UPI001E32CDF0|nr:DUF2252 family protein [Metabacillus kandeliae]MCD7036690.1 DUF2252 domain-containing protein [Metabacillus kandeliae]